MAQWQRNVSSGGRVALAALLLVLLALTASRSAASKQTLPPVERQPSGMSILHVSEEVAACCAEANRICHGPGSLSRTNWPELESFCTKLPPTCPNPPADCRTTTLDDDLSGADIVLTGLAIQPDEALARRVMAGQGGISGEAWTVLPVEVLKGTVPTERITVWSPISRENDTLFRLNEGYLLLLNAVPGFPEPVYATYRTGCLGHSRHLADQPLTEFERELIARAQGPRYHEERLAPLCASARRLADLFVAGASFPMPDLVTLVESASRLCGFTWCNPQYCH